MAIHYSNGFGKLFDKETEETIDGIKYQLIETDQTRYTNKKWWGEFTINREIKRLGKYMIEFDDGRKSECVIFTNTDRESETRTSSHYYYRFFGRGKLGGRFHRGS